MKHDNSFWERLYKSVPIFDNIIGLAHRNTEIGKQKQTNAESENNGVKIMRKIKKIDQYIKNIQQNGRGVVWVTLPKEEGERLAAQLGLKEGVLCVPAIINRFFKENVVGRIEIDKSQKETITYSVTFLAPSWGNNGYHLVTQTRTRERYKRIRHAPFELSLTFKTEADGSVTIFSEDIALTGDGLDRVGLAINMFHSIARWGWHVGEKPVKEPLKKDPLMFEILPPGVWPRNGLMATGPTQSGRARYLRENEKTIVAYGPNRAAIGLQTLQGYCAYIFESKDLVVLENEYYGNATYVIELEAWEETAKLTKYQVYSGSRLIERVIHDDNWKTAIDRLLR